MSITHRRHWQWGMTGASKNRASPAYRYRIWYPQWHNNYRRPTSLNAFTETPGRRRNHCKTVPGYEQWTFLNDDEFNSWFSGVEDEPADPEFVERRAREERERAILRRRREKEAYEAWRYVEEPPDVLAPLPTARERCEAFDTLCTKAETDLKAWTVLRLLLQLIRKKGLVEASERTNYSLLALSGAQKPHVAGRAARVAVELLRTKALGYEVLETPLPEKPPS